MRNGTSVSVIVCASLISRLPGPRRVEALAATGIASTAASIPNAGTVSMIEPSTSSHVAPTSRGELRVAHDAGRDCAG